MVGTTLTHRERRFYDQLLAPYLAAHKSGMYFTLRDLLRNADQQNTTPLRSSCAAGTAYCLPEWEKMAFTGGSIECRTIHLRFTGSADGNTLMNLHSSGEACKKVQPPRWTFHA